MRPSATARAVVLLIVFALAALPLSAQTVTGTMQGRVTDRTGAALPGVTVTVRNVDTGLERIVVTDGVGFYNAPFLPVGRYNVEAGLSGFGSMRRQNVRVDLNETVVQDFVLDPAITETVTVSADAPRINVTDGEVKQTMRSQEIMTLPALDQSSFLRLASTFSGYMENPSGGQNNPTLSSGSSANFNGAGTRGTTFQINGVNNDDSSENQHRQNVPIATIQSFQVLTNSFSAEFGRGYGAVVLLQTKQGTNTIDGEVYGYGTDAKYKSRDILTVSLSHGTNFRRQFGATAGFPIIRDTLFGFVNGDQVQNQGSVTATRGVFIATDLDPAKRLTAGNDTPANRAWQDMILSHFPQGATPNAPNVASRAYQYLQDQNFPARDYSGRLDYNMTLNNTVTARYQRSHQIFKTGEAIVGENAFQNNRQSNFGLTWTNILSSSTVQEGRIGVGIRSTNVDIGAGNDTPIVRFAGTNVPTFTILGNAGAFPIHRNQHDDQLVYNISSARWSRHTLKAGMDLRKSQLNDIADNSSRGFWNFAATCNGVNYGTGLGAFWAGCISTYQKGYGPFSLENKLTEQNAYAQDDWRPSDNLVLNLGVRYERVQPPKEENNLIDYFYKTSQYVDPRLGFAYTPDWSRSRFLRALTGGNGMFSIRGGFGIYHGRVFQSVFSQSGANVRFNPPNAALLTFTNSTNVSDPTNGFAFDPTRPLTTPVSLTLIDPKLKMPETRQWNLTFERQTFWSSRLRLSYIGTYGKDLLQYDFDNLPIRPDDPRSQYKVAADWRCAGTGTVAGIAVNATCPTAMPIADNEISLRVTRTQLRRPDQRYLTNLVVRNKAESWYHAAQMEWEMGEYHGFGGRMTYTFGKAIDTGSEATSSGTGDINIFPSNDHYVRGLSRFDTRHRFTLLGSYALPWLKNREDLLGSALGGWRLSTVIRLASGTPFTVVDGGAPDIDFDGVSNLRPVCVNRQYCGGYRVNSRLNSPNQLKPGAFRHPVYGDTLDDLLGRNTFFTDGQETVDAGLYKSFKLPAAMTFMVRFDVFNVFNRVTWGFPVNDFNSTSFGTINTTNYSPRTMQLGFRLIY